MHNLPYAHQSITDADVQAVVDVLRSDYLTQGPAVEAFESALCEYTGARYAVAVSSGTAALYLAYRAAGFSRIITSPLSFVATANAGVDLTWSVGFLDVEETTGNIDTSHGLTLITGDGLVPVHYAGRACDGKMWPAPKQIVEDACHALGAMDFDGCSRVGSCVHSLATCFSFHPCKPITTGEGGAVTTNDEGFAREVRSMRNHGREDGKMIRLGGNYRMTDIQAALGTSQLKRCDEMKSSRGHWAWVYDSELYDLERQGLLKCPGPESFVDGAIGEYDKRTSWHLYPIRIKGGKRDAVKARLISRGIGVQVHYDPPIHLHPWWRWNYAYEKTGYYPQAEAWAKEELSLPLWAGMTEDDVEYVVRELREALA